MAMGVTCGVHLHRDLVPLEVHHIWPVARGGPDTPGNRVTVCANGHGAIHDLINKLLKSGGALPWSTRRRYGRRVRDYAQQGYLASIAVR